MPIEAKHPNVLASTARTVGGVGRGIGDAVVEQGRSTAFVVGHPKRAAKGLARLVTHPVSTFAAIGRHEDEPGKPVSTPRKIGRAVGGFGLDALTMGAGAATHVAGDVQRVTQDGEAPDLHAGEAVHLGAVTRSAVSSTTEPARDALKAARHPKKTARGAGEALKHPTTIGDRAEPRAAIPDDRSAQVGRGIAWVVKRSVGVSVGPAKTYYHVSDGAQQAARVTGSN